MKWNVLLAALATLCIALVAEAKPLKPIVSKTLLYDVNGDGHVSIVCLGDSNTMQIPDTTLETYYRWCEALRDYFSVDPRISVANVSFMGEGVLTPRYGSEKQLADALAGIRHPVFGPSYPPADVVIAAFGTNDIFMRYKITDIVKGYRKIITTARKQIVLIATTPPIISANGATSDAMVTQLNKAIRGAFKDGRLVDFDSGFRSWDLIASDGVHIIEAGQRLRFERALSVILSDTIKPKQ